MSEECEMLRSRNAELEAENRRLRLISSGQIAARKKWSLSPGQWRLLCVLLDGKLHDVNSLACVYSIDGKISLPAVRVEILRLRKSLAPIEIKVVWGRGYILEPPHLEAVLSIIEAAYE